jgi:hypothetical protein
MLLPGEIILRYFLVLTIVFIAGVVAAFLILGEPRRGRDNFKKALEELYPELRGIKWTEYTGKKDVYVKEELRDAFYGLASTGIVELGCTKEGKLSAKVAEPYRRLLR